MSPGRQATRARILEGASEALVEHGLRGTSVRHVLEAASVSRRTFYQYFDNQEALLDALYERQTRKLSERMAEGIAAGDTPRARLSGGLRAFVAHQTSGGRLMRLLQAEAQTPDSRLRVRREAALQELVDLLDGAVFETLGVHLDPWIFRAFMAGIENLLVTVALEDGELPPENARRIEEVTGAMLLTLLVGRDHLPKRRDEAH